MKNVSFYQIDTEALQKTLQQAQLVALIQNQHRRLYQFILKRIGHIDDAADLTQQTFVEAYEALSDFRGDSEMSSWLHGIALTLIKNYLSRAPSRIYQFDGEEALNLLATKGDGPELQLSLKENLNLLQKHINALSADRKIVFEMVAIDEMSYQAVAKILQLPIGTVRSRVARARKQLKLALKNENLHSAFFKI